MRRRRVATTAKIKAGKDEVKGKAAGCRVAWPDFWLKYWAESIPGSMIIIKGLSSTE